jgi:hypothetical protein
VEIAVVGYFESLPLVGSLERSCTETLMPAYLTAWK